MEAKNKLYKSQRRFDIPTAIFQILLVAAAISSRLVNLSFLKGLLTVGCILFFVSSIFLGRGIVALVKDSKGTDLAEEPICDSFKRYVLDILTLCAIQ